MLRRAQLLSSIRKNYLILNWVALGYTCYLFVLPFISSYLYPVFPEFMECPYKRITHDPCPFCGVVRDAQSVFKGTYASESANNPISIIVFCVVIVEGILRFGIVLFYKNLKRIKTMMCCDALLHSIGFLVYLVYIVYYCFFKNALSMSV